MKTQMKPTQHIKILKARFVSGRMVTATLTLDSKYDGQVEVNIFPDDNKPINGYGIISSWDNEPEHALTETLGLLGRIAKSKDDPILGIKVFKEFKIKEK